MALTASKPAGCQGADAPRSLVPAAPAARAATLPAPTTAPEFARFGQWGERVSVVRDGAIHAMAYWLATHPDRREMPAARLWRDCLSANRELVREFCIVRLDAPSYFLPAGEVVFKVTENPIQLPDNPPQGVLMRHVEALMAHPLAKFYLLEPVFTSEPYFRLYTPEELREEAAGDRRVSEQIARHFGWAHRAADWTRARGRDLAGIAMRAAAWTIEQLSRDVIPGSEPHVHPHADELAALLADDTLVELARRADRHGLDRDARRLRRAIEELRWRMSIDPVLCFELEDRPGELWFEAHWFTGANGKRYVHY